MNDASSSVGDSSAKFHVTIETVRCFLSFIGSGKTFSPTISLSDDLLVEGSSVPPLSSERVKEPAIGFSVHATGDRDGYVPSAPSDSCPDSVVDASTGDSQF